MLPEAETSASTVARSIGEAATLLAISLGSDLAGVGMAVDGRSVGDGASGGDASGTLALAGVLALALAFAADAAFTAEATLAAGVA